MTVASGPVEWAQLTSSIKTTTHVPLGLVSVVSAPFRPENYGAKCDGATDDTSAWSALMVDYTALGFGDIRIPSSTSLCQGGIVKMLSSSSLQGNSRGASGLTWVSGGTSGPLIDCSDPSGASGGTNQFADITLADMRVTGPGSGSNAAIRAYYLKHSNFERLDGSSIADWLDAVQLWDTTVKTIQLDAAGTTATATSIHIRNSAAASGFGFSADNSNQVFITDIRTEAFSGRGLVIEPGTGSSGFANAIYVTNFKAETTFAISAPLVLVGAGVTNCAFRNLFLVMDSWASGTVPINGLQNNGNGSNIFDGILLGVNSVDGFASPFLQDATGVADIISNVWLANGSGGAASTSGVVVNITGGTLPIIRGFISGFPSPTPLSNFPGCVPDVQHGTTFANDAAAATGGVPLSGLYRNGSVTQMRVT